MKRKKERIPPIEKLASALLQCMRPDGNGGWERAISHDEAKMLTAHQIVSLFDFDHYPIEEQDGGPAVAWNLTPRLKPEHRKKTGADAKRRAKGKRLQKAQAAHIEAMAAKVSERPEAQRRTAVIPGSRASKWKRKLNGKVELRT